MAASTDLLFRHGLGALTMSRISGAAAIEPRRVRMVFGESDTVDAIVEAIVETQLETVLRGQRPSLAAVRTLDGLCEWRSELVGSVNAIEGCPLGMLIQHLAGHHLRGNLALVAAFGQWQQLVTEALERIKGAGELTPAADPAALSTAIMAAVQGGFLLSHTMRNAKYFHGGLDLAIETVGSFADRRSGS